MDQPTRRGRVRVATDQDIRRTARVLLVERGPEAVTLRAIARELGITAPALYRYYRSRDDLVQHLRADVVNDLAAQLAGETTGVDGAAQLFAICRGFRRWALSHTKEFTLVFASPTGAAGADALTRIGEPFGRIFLVAAGHILAKHQLTMPPAETVPAEIRNDLTTFQDELLAVLAESGVEVPADRLDIATTYVMIQFWARLYGHITLEVFGNYPIPLSEPDAVFDALLADLARETGLDADR